MNRCQSIRKEEDFGTKVYSSGTNDKQKNTSGLTALVVDDSPIVLTFAAAMLGQLG
jgi:hypothetical protein